MAQAPEHAGVLINVNPEGDAGPPPMQLESLRAVLFGSWHSNREDDWRMYEVTYRNGRWIVTRDESNG